MTHQTFEHHFDTVVIGGGQADLAIGYFLAQQDRDFVILDAGSRVGDVWRSRWFAKSSPVCPREWPPRHPANKR